MIKILNKENCPNWVKYPELYLSLVYNDKEEFLPWYLIDIEDFNWRKQGLIKRYPKRNLFYFARKDCSDDIACWEEGFGETVFIIHDYASPGWERREVFDNFKQWYQWSKYQEYD